MEPSEEPLHAHWPPAETVFEKERGVSRIEVRHGYAQVHVSELPAPVPASRLEVLRAIAEAQVSMDFLKLTPSGMSFLVPEDRAEAAERALQSIEGECAIRRGRSIVLVHAVNIRDEEGLIARTIQRAIGSGAQIDHIGDMHDRMLLVLERPHVDEVRHALETL
jgi:aspartokinase